jgi:hypothetical protein
MWLKRGLRCRKLHCPPRQAFIVLDWKDHRLVGIEILDASSRLHPDLLDEAEILS